MHMVSAARTSLYASMKYCSYRLWASVKTLDLNLWKKYFGVELLLVKSTDFVNSAKPSHFSFGETEVSTGDSKEPKSFEILVAYILEH